jgi:hypothetical protein
MDIQAHFLTIILFFSNLFQSQEDKGLIGTLRKEIPFLRYLALRASTQRRGGLETIFQPTLANKELFRSSTVQKPSPPKALG